MRKILLTILFVTLSGCSFSFNKSATVTRVCPNGKPRINLEVSNPTSKLTTGHFSIGNVVEYYLYYLPTYPEERTVYSYKDISVKEVRSIQKNIPPVISGDIIVEPKNKLVKINFSTKSGEYPGNGEYKLKIWKICKTT